MVLKSGSDDIVACLRQARRRGDAVSGYVVEVPAEIVELIIRRLERKTLRRTQGAKPT